MRYPLIAAVLSCLLLACSSQTVEFPTPLPTATPFVFPSPLPTVTPAPTTTPVSLEFPTPLPTATPFALPSPLPTVTPAPTATPVSFEFPTPLPTATPFALPSPLPTVTPAPTATPVSFEFPTPLPTATPFVLPAHSSSSFHGLDELANRGVIRIRVGCDNAQFDRVGTAWRVRTDKDDGLMFLSARHIVCEQYGRWGAVGARIYWPSELDGLGAIVEADSAEHDLVLFKVDLLPARTHNLHEWDIADATNATRVGEDVRHISTRAQPESNPGDIIPFVSAGVVSWVDANRLYTDTSGIGGDSGGLVVNSEMQVIGLLRNVYPSLVLRDDRTTRAGNTTISTPATAIRQFLIEAGYLNP